MALYKHNQYLNDSEHGAFDLLHSPGNIAPNSGIYRCGVCGAEIVSEKSKLLPAKNHHIHAEGLGQIKWRLIVQPAPPPVVPARSWQGSLPHLPTTPHTAETAATLS